jgi:hypothetical protein
MRSGPRIILFSLILIFSFSVSCLASGITLETTSVTIEVIRPITSESPSNKDEITVASLKGYLYNDIMSSMNETKIRLAYHPSEGTAYLYCKDYLSTMCFGINKAQRNALLADLKKYQMWNAQALQAGEKIDKDIATLEVSSAYFSGGEDWYEAATPTLTFAFLSQTLKKHQFLIMCPKLNSTKNSYISHVPDIIYLDLNSASALRVALGDAAINKAVTDRMNQMKVKSEFTK